MPLQIKGWNLALQVFKRKFGVFWRRKSSVPDLQCMNLKRRGNPLSANICPVGYMHLLGED
jgi:hypothetical protein